MNKSGPFFVCIVSIPITDAGDHFEDTVWAPVVISKPNVTYYFKIIPGDILNDRRPLKGLKKLSGYSWAFSMLSTPPRSKLHSLEGKRGFKIVTKTGGQVKSTVFIFMVKGMDDSLVRNEGSINLLNSFIYIFHTLFRVDE
jgi:hypothetical protein